MPVKINIQNVVKSFEVREGTFDAVRDLSLEVEDQQFVCIVGPSGCGKSTLLRMLGGLETETSGTIEVAHEDPSRPLSAMIFQEESVFPWLTVEQNAAYGLKVTGLWKGHESQDRVDYFLEKTGLIDYRSFRPHQLSGGMKQRLSVARAFAVNPEVLLMDEPFAALDEQNKLLLQEELGRLWEEFRTTVVFITHSIDEAVLLGDRVAVMSSAPGRIMNMTQVPFDRPRDLVQLRSNSEYVRIVNEVWEHLRREVIAAREQENARRSGLSKGRAA